MNKSQLKKLVPPLALEIFKKSPRYGYFGDYRSWQDALAHSTGYDSGRILDKVRDALLKVKNGQAVYERDSVLFDKAQYSWPVLAGLLWIASQNKNRLSVLDFGGSLGSSYFQNREFLRHIDLKWYIVEQNNFVACGKKHFEDGSLSFFEDIGDVSSGISVFLASSSLQYIEYPYALVERAVEKRYPYIIIDRTAFLKDSERITVQKVRPEIYEADYPAWFLDEQKFRKIFEGKYALIADFESIGAQKIGLKGADGYLHGFIYQINDAEK